MEDTHIQGTGIVAKPANTTSVTCAATATGAANAATCARSTLAICTATFAKGFAYNGSSTGSNNKEWVICVD